MKKRCKPILKKTSPYKIYEYCRDVLRKPWKNAEPYILKDQYTAYLYAMFIRCGRWVEAEDVIKKSDHALSYAINVMQQRWKDAEKYVHKDTVYLGLYCDLFLNKRFEKAERYILQDIDDAISYGKKFFKKNGWKKLEEIVLKNLKKSKVFSKKFVEYTRFAYLYCKFVLKRRWMEIEKYICQSPDWKSYLKLAFKKDRYQKKWLLHIHKDKIKYYKENVNLCNKYITI